MLRLTLASSARACLRSSHSTNIHWHSMGTRVVSIVEALQEWSGENDVEANEEMQSPNGDARFLSTSAVHKALSSWVADSINEVSCSIRLTLASVTVALEELFEDQLKNGNILQRARPHRRSLHQHQHQNQHQHQHQHQTCVFASRPLASVRR